MWSCKSPFAIQFLVEYEARERQLWVGFELINEILDLIHTKLVFRFDSWFYVRKNKDEHEGKSGILIDNSNI